MSRTCDGAICVCASIFYSLCAIRMPGAGSLNMPIDATALPRKPSCVVANTAFHESHSFSGNVMGLITALRHMLSARDTVSLPGSLQHIYNLTSVGCCHCRSARAAGEIMQGLMLSTRMDFCMRLQADISGPTSLCLVPF